MKDNQHEQLFTELTAEFEAPAFNELDDEFAATIGGGANIEFYDTNDFQQLLGSFDFGGKSELINNDKISSIIVRGGFWRLYEDVDYEGYAQTYGPGSYVLNSQLNNEVSSFIQVG
ncbi:beta/gamma crystallin-related protein [Nostoc sp.]